MYFRGKGEVLEKRLLMKCVARGNTESRVVWGQDFGTKGPRAGHHQADLVGVRLQNEPSREPMPRAEGLNRGTMFKWSLVNAETRKEEKEGGRRIRRTQIERGAHAMCSFGCRGGSNKKVRKSGRLRFTNPMWELSPLSSYTDGQKTQSTEDCHKRCSNLQSDVIIEKGENHRKAVREHYARNAEAIREKRHSHRAAAKLRRRRWDPPKKSARPEVEDDDFIPCRSSAHSVASIGRAGFLSSGSYNSECLAVPTADEIVASQALVSLGAQMRITSSCDSVLAGSSYRSSVSVQLEPTPSIKQVSCYDSVLETARYLSSSARLHPSNLGGASPRSSTRPGENPWWSLASTRSRALCRVLSLKQQIHLETTGFVGPLSRVQAAQIRVAELNLGHPWLSPTQAQMARWEIVPQERSDVPMSVERYSEALKWPVRFGGPCMNVWSILQYEDVKEETQSEKKCLQRSFHPFVDLLRLVLGAVELQRSHAGIDPAAQAMGYTNLVNTWLAADPDNMPVKIIRVTGGDWQQQPGRGCGGRRQRKRGHRCRRLQQLHQRLQHRRRQLLERRGRGGCELRKVLDKYSKQGGWSLLWTSTQSWVMSKDIWRGKEPGKRDGEALDSTGSQLYDVQRQILRVSDGTLKLMEMRMMGLSWMDLRAQSGFLFGEKRCQVKLGQMFSWGGPKGEQMRGESWKKTAWLLDLLPSYVEHQAEKTLFMFWARMQQDWFTAFPEELELGFPPPDVLADTTSMDDGNPDVPESIPLSGKQIQKLGDTIDKHKKQLASWYRHQRLKLVDVGAVRTKAESSLMSCLLKSKKVHQRHKPIEVFQTRNKEDINESLAEEGFGSLNEEIMLQQVKGWAEESVGDELARKRQLKSLRMKLRTRVVDAHWAVASPEERKICEEISANETRLAVEEEAADGVERTLVVHMQRAIDEAAEVRQARALPVPEKVPVQDDDSDSSDDSDTDSEAPPVKKAPKRMTKPKKRPAPSSSPSGSVTSASPPPVTATPGSPPSIPAAPASSPSVPAVPACSTPARTLPSSTAAAAPSSAATPSPELPLDAPAFDPASFGASDDAGGDLAAGLDTWLADFVQNYEEQGPLDGGEDFDFADHPSGLEYSAPSGSASSAAAASASAPAAPASSAPSLTSPEDLRMRTNTQQLFFPSNPAAAPAFFGGGMGMMQRAAEYLSSPSPQSLSLPSPQSGLATRPVACPAFKGAAFEKSADRSEAPRYSFPVQASQSKIAIPGEASGCSPLRHLPRAPAHADLNATVLQRHCPNGSTHIVVAACERAFHHTTVAFGGLPSVATDGKATKGDEAREKSGWAQEGDWARCGLFGQGQGQRQRLMRRASWVARQRWQRCRGRTRWRAWRQWQSAGLVARALPLPSAGQPEQDVEFIEILSANTHSAIPGETSGCSPLRHLPRAPTHADLNATVLQRHCPNGSTHIVVAACERAFHYTTVAFGGLPSVATDGKAAKGDEAREKSGWAQEGDGARTRAAAATDAACKLGRKAKVAAVSGADATESMEAVAKRGPGRPHKADAAALVDTTNDTVASTPIYTITNNNGKRLREEEAARKKNEKEEQAKKQKKDPLHNPDGNSPLVVLQRTARAPVVSSLADGTVVTLLWSLSWVQAAAEKKARLDAEDAELVKKLATSGNKHGAPANAVASSLKRGKKVK
ncbi:hypothetical protein B0H10DRAFT_2381729 [Mycena sp. CBHHK59/15]|nr:hypothetical protein B0H10DRAFT_2381729 [Mycena sp. CBHHK59/15]